MLIIRWNDVEEILQRPCYGPKNGVELFTCEKKHYSFNFLTLETTKKFFNLAAKLKKNKEFGLEIITDTVQTFKEKKFADLWKDGDKSN